MNWNKLPLWSAALVVSIISFFFQYHPDYTIDYLLGFNAVMWSVCGLYYAGESVYFKIKRKNANKN